MREGTAVTGRYRLLERIGAGGMGEVWRATDELLNRVVAVKVVLPALHTDPSFGRRFLTEARAMASVRHPGVVAIHDFGETPDPDAGQRPGADRVAYLVMEYVEGEVLSRMLGRVGRLSPATTMDLVGQVAQALQAVHDHGIVHRDVKPANLMVRADGTVVLADFGIAVTADATALTQPGMILGTPSYLAPEQVLGQPASARSDVYALGLVAYECLAGQKPFVAEEPYAVALQRVHRAAPALPPDVPPPVAEVVSRALVADPKRRWQTAAEFAAAAERAAGERSSRWAAGDGAAGVPPARRRLMSRTLAAAGTGVVVLALVAAGVAALWDARDPASRDAAGPSATRTASASSGTGTTSGASGAADQGGGEPGGGWDTRQVPAGFVTCGEAMCTATPACWRGLVQQGDRAFPPGVADCTAPHYWETFAATYLPADATTDRELSRLMERADVAAICSEAAMAERSRDRARTEGWRREAWPIPVDAYTILVHCLAGSPDGETVEAVFDSR